MSSWINKFAKVLYALSKQEDSAHTSGDYGFPIWGVRKDTATAMAAENDYHPFLFNASGELHVTSSGGGSLPSLGPALSAASLPVVIATDDAHFGTVGAAADVDGHIHGQLRFIGEAVDGLETDLATIAGDTTSLDGKTPSLGNAAMAASVPVTLASDDTHLGAVGAAADVDGSLHAQLRYIGEASDSLATLLGTIDADTSNLATYLVDLPNVIGIDGAAGPSKALSIAGTDVSGNLQELRVDSNGRAEVVNPNRTPQVLPYTGSGAISITTSIGAAFKLLSITLHLSGAGTTSENFVVKLDALDGAAYDTSIITEDLSEEGATDMIWLERLGDFPKEFEAGDELNITWANTETRTYGLRLVYELI